MATKLQIPVLVGSIVSNQESFATLPVSDAQWAIENTAEAIGLAIKAIQERNQFASTVTRKIPSSEAEQLEMWKEIYATYFGFEAHQSFNLITHPTGKDGFGWFVVVRKDITMNMVLRAMRTKMKVYSYIGDDLDSGVPTNERTSEKGDYAIFVRDGIEPDTDLRNTSANQIAKKKLQTMTLLERLLLELFYFHFTGEHLDVNGWTICAGSRFSDGNVACVYWYSNGGEVLVGWCNTSFSDDDAGARAVQQ